MYFVFVGASCLRCPTRLFRYRYVKHFPTDNAVYLLQATGFITGFLYCVISGANWRNNRHVNSEGSIRRCH